MEEFLKSFIVYITSTALVIGAGAWIVRKLIDNFFSHKVEEFKANLEKENARYKITYEKLHSERALVIKETYQKLVDMFNAFQSYINPMQMAGEPSMEEKAKDAIKKGNEFIHYFDRNRIFFEENLAKRIDVLCGLLWDCWTSYGLSKISREGGDHKESLEMWNKAWQKLTTEVPKIKKGIEKEFQAILGIEG